MNTTTNVSNNPITTNLSIENLPNENWKPIKGYEGLYEISSLGRLKRILKYRKFRNYQEKILKPSKDKDGYFRTTLTAKNKVRKNVIIHRVVALNFIINHKNKPCVNHKNGIKSDNNLHNLEWCTVKENNVHAIRLGLAGQSSGEKHHMSKLTKNQVVNIIDLYSNKKYSQRKLSDIFNISQTQISRIINKKRWQHI